MTEKEPILVSCPGCRTTWQLLAVDGDRQTWGMIDGFAGDEVSLYGSPVKGKACWHCAPIAAAKALGDQAVDYIAEEMAAGNLTTAEADDLRKYLRNEG